jgi:hypothetical protein
MVYASLDFQAPAQIQKSRRRRIHWERVALIAANFLVWAYIVRLFL